MPTMLLIGQYDSPFVRRVAVALRHYEIPFSHEGHGVFADAERIAEYNPLRRVPTLVLDDGTVLYDSTVILEILDGRVAAEYGDDSPSLLLPRHGPLRERGLRAIGFLTGALDKAVALIYEANLRDAKLEAWVTRCTRQLQGTLAMLNAEWAQSAQPYLMGSTPSHADIFATCGLTLVDEALPGLLSKDAYPALRSVQKHCEALPIFEGIYLPFIIRQ